jgi:hypothetical protein
LDQPILKNRRVHALTKTCDGCVVPKNRFESFSAILLGVSWFSAQKEGALSQQGIPRLYLRIGMSRLGSFFPFMLSVHHTGC